VLAPFFFRLFNCFVISWEVNRAFLAFADRFAARGIADMALQPRLGILSNRRAWTRAVGCDHFDGHRQDLTVAAINIAAARKKYGGLNMLLRAKRHKYALCIMGAALLLAAPASYLRAGVQETAPDDTRANQEPGKTADQQKENTSDRELARQIRKALVSDKSLSTYAHNVKIIATNGLVTLRGPVRSEDEKAAIEAKAKAVAGVADVRNELTIAPKRTQS
jgi:hyperosmotically inducible protein